MSAPFAHKLMRALVGPVIISGKDDSGGGTPVTPQVFNGFTAGNTANIKDMINKVVLGVSSQHMAIPGNSTKAGTGSNGTAFGVPSGIAAARRALSQVFLAAPMLAALYGITVSTDNFWGDAGWSTPFSNIQTFDPRISSTGTPTFSSSILGPGGRALTTTDATSTITFTPSSGRQFNSFTIFFAGTGGAISIKGNNDATTYQTTGNALNTNYKQTITFSAACTSVTFSGASASGIRVYGGYVETANLVCLHLHNMGWSGSGSANWANAAQGQSPAAIINLLAPRTVWFSEDINDPNTGVSLATHTSNLTTFLNAVKSPTCDIVVYTDHWTASSDVDSASGHATLSYLQQSYAATDAVATALGCPEIKSHVRYVSYAHQKNDLGYMWDISHMLSTAAGPTVGQFDQAANLIVPGVIAAMNAGTTSPFLNMQDMTAWQAKRAAVVSQTARATIILAGDSARASYFADNVANYQAIHAQDARLAKAFASMGVPATYQSGFGGHGSVQLSDWDFRFSQGNWFYEPVGTYGITQGGEFLQAGSAATITMTPQDDQSNPIATSACDVYYAQDPSQGGINGQCDSNTVVPISQNNALSKVLKTTLTATLGNHTWKAIWASGSANWIGFVAYDSSVKAIDCLNMAAIGSYAAQWADTTYSWNPPNAWAAYPPAAILFSAGANDFIDGTPLATIQPKVVSAIQSMQAAGHFVIVCGYPPVATTVLSAAQQDQLAAMQLAAAQATNCIFYDQMNRLGGSNAYTANNAAGIMGDTEHLNFKGYTTPVVDLYSLLAA